MATPIEIKDKMASFVEKISTEKKPITYTEGKKFYKLIEPSGTYGNSAFAFIDKNTGDIFKCASWNAPAKGVRGNVLSEQNGMESVNNDYGFWSINYNRKGW